MSILNILILLFFLANYMLLVFDQNRYMLMTVSYLIRDCIDYYELEGYLNYGLAFYKSFYSSISLPYRRIFNVDKENSIELYINNINKNIIEMKVSKYKYNKLLFYINCKFEMLHIENKNNIKFKSFIFKKN